MPRTRAQLVAKALSILQEEGSGQPLSNEDKTVVDDAVEPLAAELASSEVLLIGDLEAIDDDVFLPLARMLANEVGDDFGRPYSEDYRALQERRMKRVTASSPTYAPQTTDYF
jgi:hypothetical protein